MLLFFDQDFNLKAVKRYGFHEIALAELRMMKYFKFANMLLEYDGAGEIQRLTQLVQNRHPALYIRGSCESELPHDFRLYFLTRQRFCPDTHYFWLYTNQPMNSAQPVS